MEDGRHRTLARYSKGTYIHYSNTTSGWSISTNMNAEAGKRWRAEHPQFGTKYFANHDDILKFTVEHMRQQFMKLQEKNK